MISELEAPENSNPEIVQNMLLEAYNQLYYSKIDKKTDVKINYDSKKRYIRLEILNNEDNFKTRPGRITRTVITIGIELYDGQYYLYKKKSNNEASFNPWEQDLMVSVCDCFEVFELDGNKVAETTFINDRGKKSQGLSKEFHYPILDNISVGEVINPLKTKKDF